MLKLFNFFSPYTPCESLQANLSEIYVALNHTKVNSIPLRMTSENTVRYSRSWVALIDRFFNGEQSPETSLKVVDYTIRDLFNRVVNESYRGYHQRVLNWVKLIGKSHSTPPETQVSNEQKERYKTFTLSSFGQFETDQGIPESIEKYFEAYDQEIQTDTLDTSQTDKIRSQMTLCSEATRFFWKSFINPNNEGFFGPIKERIPSTEFVPLNNSTLFNAFKRAQSLIDIEGILEMDIPIVALAKIGNPDQLLPQEKQQLAKWVNKLNERKKAVDFGTFSNALTEIIQIIAIEGRYSLTLDQLLLKLNDLNCELIQDEDPEHVSWRNRLAAGSKIDFRGETLTLGNELGEDESDNQVRIFTLEGPEHQDHVIKIAQNRFLLKIEAAKMHDENCHWGINPAKIIETLNAKNQAIPEIDPQGRFILQEKLTSSLADQEWTSFSPELSQHDLKKALVVANHIRCMKEWEATPEQLNPKQLMFDSEGILKTIRPNRKKPFNYNVFEQFCKLVGKGNVYIVDFLMHVSKLICHPIADFYREAVGYTFSTGNTNLLGLPQHKKYRNDEHEEHVEYLCKQAQAIRLECFKTIKKRLSKSHRHEYTQDEQLREAINNKLLQLYQASSTPGIIDPTLKERVIESFLENTNAAPAPPAKDYYKKVSERLDQFNKAAKIET